MLERPRVLACSPFASALVALHCGGGDGAQPVTSTPSATASATTPPAASSAAVAEPPPLQCPAPKPPKSEQVVATPAGCPDTSTADAVAKLDFAKAFYVDGKVNKDLHGAILLEAARGHVDAFVRATTNVMKTLSPDLEKASDAKPNKQITECYEKLVTNESLSMTQIVLEGLVSTNVTASATLQKK